MKALHLWFLVAITLITASLAMADTADISGLVYLAGAVMESSDKQCYPITGATVTLLKRTANRQFQQFGDEATTTSDGYYLFSDITIDDPYGLFENADWCKIVVNADGCLPGQWPGPTSLIRYVNKEPRDGVLRVDYIFYDWFSQTPPIEHPDAVDEMGHAAVNGGDGHAVSIPNSDADIDNEQHIATCPIDQNPTDFHSCIGGHWTIYDSDLIEWGSLSPGYARYEFYGYTEDPPPDTIKVGEGYYYWDNDWPYWALHQDGAQFYIAIDFVDMPFPPSREARQAKSDKPVATKPVIANLYPVVPNPSRGSASISFELTQPAAVSLIVYDMAGRKVSILVDGQVGAGRHDVAVTDLVPGVYTYCLEIPGYKVAKKMVVTR